MDVPGFRLMANGRVRPDRVIAGDVSRGALPYVILKALEEYVERNRKGAKKR